jgi:hypothetical protein
MGRHEGAIIGKDEDQGYDRGIFQTAKKFLNAHPWLCLSSRKNDFMLSLKKRFISTLRL